MKVRSYFSAAIFMAVAVCAVASHAAGPIVHSISGLNQNFIQAHQYKSLPQPGASVAPRHNTLSPALTSPPKWLPAVEVTGKFSNDRQIGRLNFMFPVMQDKDSLLLLDLRGVGDDNESFEGNVGIAWRQMLQSGWNVGGYGFFDARKSPNHNEFYQTTFGMEALGENFDVRANVYLPLGDKEYTVNTASKAELNGTVLQIRGGKEKALTGFDGEIGYRLPVFGLNSPNQIRIYGGGFHFFDPDLKNITGTRGRLELALHDIPHLPPQSRITLGGEIQDDNGRGTEYYGEVRFRIPLQTYKAGGRTNLTPQERRMMDTIIRDVDIVTQAAAIGTPETAIDPATGAALTDVAIVDASTDLATALPTNAFIIVDGSKGVVTPSGNVTLNANQTLVGGGIPLVTSANGATATLPGTRPTIDTTNGKISNAANTIIRDMILENGPQGLDLRFGGNTLVSNVTLNNHTTIAIDIASNNIVRNTTINNAMTGIFINIVAGSLIEDSHINNSTFGLNSIVGNTVTIRNTIFTNNLLAIASNTDTGYIFDNVQIMGGTFGISLNTSTNAGGAISTTGTSTPCSDAGGNAGSTLLVNGVACP